MYEKPITYVFWIALGQKVQETDQFDLLKDANRLKMLN